MRYKKTEKKARFGLTERSFENLLEQRFIICERKWQLTVTDI